MELDVWLPLGLHAYEAWKSGALQQADLLGVLRLVESYLFRRWAAGVPSQGLNKVFPSVLPQLSRGGNYLGTLRDFLHQLPGTRRFPQDEEFRAGLMTRDLYSARSWSRYTLGRLENHDHKEAFTDLSGFTMSTSCRRTRSSARSGRRCSGRAGRRCRTGTCTPSAT